MAYGHEYHCPHPGYPCNCKMSGNENPTIFVLKKALEKVQIYRDHTSGEYQGGMEHTMLVLINKKEIQRLDKNGD